MDRTDILQQLVTVIVPIYNNFTHIEKTLISILCQDYKKIELIVTDDASSEFYKFEKEIEEIIKKNRRDNLKDYHIIHLPENRGTVRNLNQAIGKANGNYIKVLASDDEFYDETSLSQMVFYAKQVKADIIAARMLLLGQKGTALFDGKTNFIYRWKARGGRLNLCTPTNHDIKRLENMDIALRNRLMIRKCVIATPAVLFRRDVFEKYGYFNESYRILEDMPYWPNVITQGGRIEFMDSIVVKYRLNGISNGGKGKSEFQAEKNRVMMELYLRRLEDESILEKLSLFYPRREIRYKETEEWKNNKYKKLFYLDVILYRLYIKMKYLFLDSRI